MKCDFSALEGIHNQIVLYTPIFHFSQASKRSDFGKDLKIICNKLLGINGYEIQEIIAEEAGTQKLSLGTLEVLNSLLTLRNQF